MLSIGILYRSTEIIKLLDEIDISKERFLKNFPYYKFIPSKYIVDVSTGCGWVKNNSDDHLKPTERGYDLLCTKDPVMALRKQIKDVLEAEPPTWLHAIRQGRKQVVRFMSKDEIQCFENANLLNDLDFFIVNWWDQFVVKEFEKDSRKRYLTGRKGEYLTLIFERLRTDNKPTLVSLDVNFAGYDVLSQNSVSDNNPLFIEVKSSILNWNQATFILSRNEWDVFTKNKNSRIYLWSFAAAPLFSDIKYAELTQAIPQDQGSGRWKDVEIPFRLAKPIQNPFQTFGPIDPKVNEEISYILNEKDPHGQPWVLANATQYKATNP